MARCASHATSPYCPYLPTGSMDPWTYGPLTPVDPTPDLMGPTLARVVPTPGTLTHTHQSYGPRTFPGLPGGCTMTSRFSPRP